jgi:hypothetical protein
MSETPRATGYQGYDRALHGPQHSKAKFVPANNSGWERFKDIGVVADAGELYV